MGEMSSTKSVIVSLGRGNTCGIVGTKRVMKRSLRRVKVLDERLQGYGVARPTALQ